MLKTVITIDKDTATIYFENDDNVKIKILDENCINLIVEKLSFDITNDVYIIKQINKLKKNKLESLERYVNEYYDNEIISLSNIELFTSDVTKILDNDSSIPYNMTDKNTKLLFFDKNKQIYVYNPKEREKKFYRAYIKDSTLIITNYKWTGTEEGLTYSVNTGRLSFNDLDEFINTYNIK